MIQISDLLTNESVIAFTDGSIAKGSKEVGDLIMQCCEAHTDGFIKGSKILFGKGVVIGIVIGGVGIGINAYVKYKKSKKKISEKEA